MASLTLGRALVARPFTAAGSGRLRRGPAPPLARRDSFMVEARVTALQWVEIAEDELEDVAVRRYMKAVMQSGVINKLRARRHKETKIETYKRKLQERAQARKLGILEPTWDEFYGENSLYENGTPPFDDFFKSPDDDLEDVLFDNGSGAMILDQLDYGAYDSNPWGYQSGYQQQQGGGGSWQAPAAAVTAGGSAGDTFDLAAYEQQQQQQQSGGYADQQQQPNGYQY